MRDTTRRRVANGHPHHWFYWDDVPGRRLRTDAMTQEQALDAAKKLAREEQDKLGR